MDTVIERQEDYLYAEENGVDSRQGAEKKTAVKTAVKKAASATSSKSKDETTSVKSTAASKSKATPTKIVPAKAAASKTEASKAAKESTDADGAEKKTAVKKAASATSSKSKDEATAVKSTAASKSKATPTETPAEKQSEVEMETKDVVVAESVAQKKESVVGAEKVATRQKVEEPDKSITYKYDLEFIASQTEALLVERDTYLEQANILREEAESLVREAEPGDVQFDEESGEGGTATVDRERDLALSAQALNAVEEINYALHKIETGRYGVCEGCGQLIVKDRLEALPYARLCVACKSGGLSRR